MRHRPANSAFACLFQRRKRLGNDGLIVMEEAAPERHQSQQEERQRGDHTHYTPPDTQNYGRI